MRCRFCFTPITFHLECKYLMCSHCVKNFHERPDGMSLEVWLSQFEPMHENQFGKKYLVKPLFEKIEKSHV